MLCGGGLLVLRAKDIPSFNLLHNTSANVCLLPFNFLFPLHFLLYPSSEHFQASTLSDKLDHFRGAHFRMRSLLLTS